MLRHDAQLQRVLDAPHEFISRLHLLDEKGADRKFDQPHYEQIVALQDFCDPATTVVHLKPRQIGDTTVLAAANFHYVYRATDAVRCLVVAHEDDATDAIFQKLHYFHDSLPPFLQRDTFRSNKKELVFKDTKGGFRCQTAGGKGGGRAWTYQRLHGEEVAFWPNASQIWASVTSTMHEGPHLQKLIISTPNGPGNFYHQKVLQAQKATLAGDPTIRFSFFKWSDHRSYATRPPRGWEPDQAEYELAQLHGLSMEQLYWRHVKIHGVDGIGEALFRREYPLTLEDGFLVFEGSWFDADYLNVVLSSLTPKEGETRIFRKPVPGEVYVAGIDPSWANGGDYAVCQIMTAEGEQVACFSTNEGGELRFSEKAAELCAVYNKARALIEHNTGGAGPVVLREFMKTGLPLWKAPPDIGQKPRKRPKFWTTHRGNKQMGYARLRQAVNGDALTLHDFATVQELLHIREKDGKIEGQDGYHDDHADALMLAEINRMTAPGSFTKDSAWRRRYKAAQNPFDMSTRAR